MSSGKVKEPVSVVVLAGGSGLRFKSNRAPKQLAVVRGKPLFVHCLKTYAAMREVHRLYLVVNVLYASRFKKDLKKHGLSKKVDLVVGGRDRQRSVENALSHIPGKGFVIIQNGVSPVTPPDLIRRCLRLAKSKGAATAFIPPYHTVFLKRGNRLLTTLERKELGYTCDPQVYRTTLLKKALASAERWGLTNRPTLDLMRRIGMKVYLVESEATNLKVTIPADLSAAESVLKKR